ncbi:MAG: hypothetical protein AMXMBFR34_23990 [Myxococcaceae bacterium]
MSDLPRLLFCCFDVVPGPSAISRRLTEYIKGLSERFQVVVLSAKTPDHPHIERYHGARLLRVPVGSGDLPSRSQTFDRAVRRQLESEEYGLVHFFDPFAGYALCERKGELGYRLIYDACTFPSVEIPLENPALEANRRFVARVRRQELFCLMNADGVVVGSPLTADWIAGLGVERDRVRVLRAPVDLEPFKPEVMGKPDATPMKVLHLGRITRGQGLETLLEALSLALQTVDVRLTVVSPKSPEAQARLEAQVAALKLSGKVEFQAPVGHDDIYKVLATADVGALTLDDGERNQKVGTPLARLGEYLAAGRPVIAADVTSAKVLLPAEGAVLYRPGDARSLADALVQLATDTERRVTLGAAAREAAFEWDSARVRLELFKLYADVTGASVEGAPRDASADPYEPTQLGSVPTDPGEVTQLGARARSSEDSGVGTNKVKTDPAIAARPDSSTDSAAKAERPAIMGVLLRDDVQVTEPGAKPASEPPVVMGSPLREANEGRATVASVAAALSEAVPAPIPGFDVPPPVAEGKPAGAPADEAAARTDQRPPAEVSLPAPSVPTFPEAIDRTAPASAPAAPVFVPPLTEALPGPPPSVPPESGRPRRITGSFDVRAASSGTVDAPRASPQAAAPSPRASTLADVPAVASPPGRTTRTTGAQPIAEGTSRSPTSPELESPRASAAPAPLRATGPSAVVGTSGRTTGLHAAPLVSPPGEPARGSGLPPAAPDLSAPSTSARPAGLHAAPPASQDAAAASARPTGLPVPADAPIPAGTTSGRATGHPAPPPRREEPTTIPMPPAPPAGAAARSGLRFTPSPPRAETVGPPPMPGGPPPLPGTASSPGGPRTRSGTSLPAVVSTPSGTVAAAGAPRPSSPAITAPPTPDTRGPASTDEDIAEIGADEVMDVDDAPAPGPSDTGEEIMEADEAVQTVDTDPSPPPSALDPWLAQLVHGYCPPESHLFDRHTPPTTMPGRDT